MAGGGNSVAGWSASFEEQRTIATYSSGAADLLRQVKQPMAAAKEEKKYKEQTEYLS